jgi:hypothetical protein
MPFERTEAARSFYVVRFRAPFFVPLAEILWPDSQISARTLTEAAALRLGSPDAPQTQPSCLQVVASVVLDSGRIKQPGLAS